METLSRVEDELIDEAYVSVPRPLEFPTTGGKTAHALFYPPHNPDFEAPAGERPPLIVRVHGGPTAHVSAHAAAGDPVLHQPRPRGRRRQLRRQHRLRARVPRPAARPVGDRRRRRQRQRGAAISPTAVRSTASAWRSPAAARAAGRCCARSRSSPTCSPAARTTSASRTSRASSRTPTSSSRATTTGSSGRTPNGNWDERSPLTHADRIRVPVIVLQGLEDRVVPPSQSELVVAALERNQHPAHLPRLRGRAARVPQGVEPAPSGRGGARLLRRGAGLHAFLIFLRPSSAARIAGSSAFR